MAGSWDVSKGVNIGDFFQESPQILSRETNFDPLHVCLHFVILYYVQYFLRDLEPHKVDNTVIEVLWDDLVWQLPRELILENRLKNIH